MGATKIISSDSHVIEPPDLWQERMPKSFGDRVPRLGKGEEAGADDFYVDGRPIGVLIRSLTDAGSRFEVNYTSGVSHFLQKLAFQVRLP